jgi:hypothetical protein
MGTVRLLTLLIAELILRTGKMDEAGLTRACVSFFADQS